MKHLSFPLALALWVVLAGWPDAVHADAAKSGTLHAEAMNATPDGSENRPTFGRGDRYCELLLIRLKGMTPTAEVWGTPGLNDCPAESWQALDTRAIRSKTGAFAVRLNGPRIILPNSITGSLPSPKRQKFGDLEMRQLATLEVNPRQGKSPYSERTVRRTTTFTFNAGEEIYELTSKKGKVYVMQSMSQIVDSNLTLADLSSLGSRLELPKGWSYRARTLDAELVVKADGKAVVIQDDLKNTYQRLTLSASSRD